MAIRFWVSLPVDLQRWLTKHCQDEGDSVSSIVAKSVRQYQLKWIDSTEEERDVIRDDTRDAVMLQGRIGKGRRKGLLLLRARLEVGDVKKEDLVAFCVSGGISEGEVRKELDVLLDLKDAMLDGEWVRGRL